MSRKPSYEYFMEKFRFKNGPTVQRETTSTPFTPSDNGVDAGLTINRSQRCWQRERLRSQFETAVRRLWRFAPHAGGPCRSIRPSRSVAPNDRF